MSLVVGLALAAAVSGGAYLVTAAWPHAIGAPALAILIGAAVAVLWQVPAAARPGLDFAVRRLLRVAIVLLGARFGVNEIFAVGGSSLIVIIACLCVTLGAGAVVVARLRGPRVLPTLIVLGTAICGNSAIIAAAPILRAQQRDVAYAVVTITLLGLGAVLIYPLLGTLLQLDDRTFGLWAGTAINDTAQVVAAGYGYGQQAGDTAAIVKLTRNLFIAPALVGLALLYRTESNSTFASTARTALPFFVIGFFAMAVARSLGVLEPMLGPAALHEWATMSSASLMVVALSAVGLQTRLGELRASGLAPLRLGLLLTLTLAAVSLLLSTGASVT